MKNFSFTMAKIERKNPSKWFLYIIFSSVIQINKVTLSCLDSYRCIDKADYYEVSV